MSPARSLRTRRATSSSQCARTTASGRSPSVTLSHGACSKPPPNSPVVQVRIRPAVPTALRRGAAERSRAGAVSHLPPLLSAVLGTPSRQKLVNSSDPSCNVAQAKSNFNQELVQLRLFTRFGVGQVETEPTGVMQKAANAIGGGIVSAFRKLDLALEEAKVRSRSHVSPHPPCTVTSLNP